MQQNLSLIQLLRGLASLLVVLLHISTNFKENLNGSFLGGLFLFGGSGVDIFFVLSGFIITYSSWQYLGLASKAVTFLKKRFIRVFPIYWTVIIFFLLLQIALPAFYKTPFSFKPSNIISTFFLFPNHTMVNGVSWSLTNELFFYTIFLVAIIVPNKKITFLLLLSWLTILMLISFCSSGKISENTWLSIFTNAMNIEFLLGVLVVLLLPAFHKKILYPTLFVGFIWFIISAVLTNKEIVMGTDVLSHAAYRVLLFGLPSFLIILPLVKMELSKNIHVNTIFLSLGNASYSIYLIHLPIVAAYFKILKKLNISNQWVLTLLSIAVVFAVCKLGIILYRMVEQPLIKKANRLLL